MISGMPSGVMGKIVAKNIVHRIKKRTGKNIHSASAVSCTHDLVPAAQPALAGLAFYRAEFENDAHRCFGPRLT